MYYATLVKIETKHKNLRTEDVTGLVTELPRIGSNLFMYAESLDGDKNKARYVYTSVVRDLKEKGGEILFSTDNSVYLLKNIKRAMPGGAI